MPAPEAPPVDPSVFAHPDTMADWMKGLPAISDPQPKGGTPSPSGGELPPNVEAPPAIEDVPEPKVEPAPEPEPPPTKPEPVKEPEAKKPEPPPADDEKWPRTKNDWDTFKANRKKEREALEAKAKAIEAERDQWKAKAETAPAVPADYETIKKERDELSNTVKAIAVENHPRFKQYYGGKIGAQIELAKRIVGPDKATDIANILNMPDNEYKEQKFAELTADLTTMKQTQLGGVLNTITSLQAERDAEISKAKESYEALQKDSQSKAQAQRQAVEKAFNDALAAASKDDANGNPAFILQEGKDDWNREVEARKEQARKLLFGQSTPETIIKTALTAVAYPAVVKMALAQSERIKALEEQIASMTKATPSPKPEAKPETTAPPPAPAPRVGMRPQEVTGEWMKTLPSLR